MLKNEVNVTDSAALIKQIAGLLFVCLTRRGSKATRLVYCFGWGTDVSSTSEEVSEYP